MKTLAIADGDLVVTPYGHQTISGPLKIKQELICAFLETLGNDRFHTDWGSLIPEYIGQPIGDETQMLVLSEANRVLQNYIAVQQREVLYDVNNQTASRFDTSDVVRSVTDIQAIQVFDAIYVKVSLTTLNGEEITLTSEVTA